jgi:tetratricopeptide (TPR) repeat protein
MARRIRLGQAMLVVVLGVSVAGCGQFGNLKARRHAKEANDLYAQADYRKAVAEYEEAIKSDPTMDQAYFYLGNSYDNLYKVARKGEAENDGYLAKAVSNYQIAVEREKDPARKKLALQYLAAAYGTDKLNDPSKAEPIVKQMIDMDPKDTGSYFGLAKLFQDAGRVDEAEKVLLQAKGAAPNDSNVYLQLAAFYNTQGNFDKAAEAYEARAAMDPTNPEAYWMIAAFFEEKVRKDYRLDPKVKQAYVTKGIEATDKALAIKADFSEALTYKNLLLRQQALLEKDPKKQQDLIKQADALREKAIELRNLKTKGVGA